MLDKRTMVVAEGRMPVNEESKLKLKDNSTR